MDANDLIHQRKRDLPEGLSDSGDENDKNQTENKSQKSMADTMFDSKSKNLLNIDVVSNKSLNLDAVSYISKVPTQNVNPAPNPIAQ